MCIVLFHLGPSDETHPEMLDDLAEAVLGNDLDFDLIEVLAVRHTLNKPRAPTASLYIPANESSAANFVRPSQ